MRRLLIGAVTAALALACTPGMASAEDINPSEVAADTLELAADIAAAPACYAPFIKDAQPAYSSPTQHITANASVYYLETWGADITLSCAVPTGIAILTVKDESPLSPVQKPYARTTATRFSGTHVRPTAQLDVPYAGIDAPVLRPLGQITIHVEVKRILSSGRFSPSLGCREWHLVFQPAVGIITYPSTGQGVCTNGAFALIPPTSGAMQPV